MVLPSVNKNKNVFLPASSPSIAQPPQKAKNQNNIKLFIVCFLLMFSFLSSVANLRRVLNNQVHVETTIETQKSNKHNNLHISTDKLWNPNADDSNLNSLPTCVSTTFDPIHNFKNDNNTFKNDDNAFKNSNNNLSLTL